MRCSTTWDGPTMVLQVAWAWRGRCENKYTDVAATRWHPNDNTVRTPASYFLVCTLVVVRQWSHAVNWSMPSLLLYTLLTSWFDHVLTRLLLNMSKIRCGSSTLRETIFCPYQVLWVHCCWKRSTVDRIHVCVSLLNFSPWSVLH